MGHSGLTKITPICFHSYRENRLWQEHENRQGYVNYLTSNLLLFELKTTTAVAKSRFTERTYAPLYLKKFKLKTMKIIIQQ